MSGARLVVHASRPAPDRVAYRVVLENAGPAAFERTAPTSQLVEAVARAGDREVHRYSAGRFFLQVLTPIAVAPGATRDLGGDAFAAPAGPVEVEAWLLGDGPRVAARATA